MNDIFRRILSVLFFLLFLFSNALAYSPQGPLKITRVQQNNDGGECWKCSIATIQAYYLKKYTYNGVTEEYKSYGTDSVWNTDPVWNKVRDINNNNIWIHASFSKLPVPMSYKMDTTLYEVMKTCYEQLSLDKPVFIKTDKHASVVISYNGSGNVLKASDFTVMEVKEIKETKEGVTKTYFTNSISHWNQYASNPIKEESSIQNNGPCYLSLDVWTARNKGYDGSYGIAWIPAPLGNQLNLVSQNGRIIIGESGIYQPDEIIEISAEPDYGYLFAGWTSSNGGVFSDPKSSTCKFTMPDCDTTVSATFVKNSLAANAAWKNNSITNITQTDAQANASLRITPSDMFVPLLKLPSVSDIYCFAGRTQADVMGATPTNHGSAYYFRYTNPEYSEDTGGRTYFRSALSLSAAKNDKGTSLSLHLGDTCYVKWAAVINDSPIYSDITTFSMPAPPSTYWYNMQTNASGLGLFNGWIAYDKGKKLTEAGCFVSPDRKLVENAVRGNKNGTAFKMDADPNGLPADDYNGKSATVAFYKAPPFDTISSFTPGVKYYYKFYGLVEGEQPVYSAIGEYVNGTAATYPLNVNATVGGAIASAADALYAAGNVINLTAVPKSGYTFTGWTTDSGVLSDAASLTCTLTMASAAANVVANFVPTQYQIIVDSLQGGSVDTSVSGKYPAGSTITLKATPAPGYIFSQWTSYYNGTFADVTSPTTTFTMPGNSLSVFAEFVEDASSVRFDQEYYNIEMEQSQQIIASVLPESSINKSLRFSSSNEAIATVDQNGFVTMHHMGSATIRATAYNGIYGETTVHCMSPIDEMIVSVENHPSFSLTDILMANVGDTLKYKITTTGNQNLINAFEREIYDSNNLLSIDENNGTITLMKPGITYLSVDYYDIASGQRVSAGSSSSCAIVINDPASTLNLPKGLKTLSDEALINIPAWTIVIPDSVKKIGSGVINNPVHPHLILMNTHIEREIAADAFESFTTYIIETGDQYNDSFFDKYIDSEWHYWFNGVSEPDPWSGWSDWSETPIESSSTVEVETKTQYRSAPVSKETAYTAWSAWSAWSEASQSIPDINLKQQETCPGYGYYYYPCKNCGRNMHVYGNCSTAWGGCGASGTAASTYGDFYVEVLPTGLNGCTQWYSTSRKYVISPTSGKPVFYWIDAPAQPYSILHRYRTRSSYQQEVTGTFGAWQDSYIESSSTTKVETRILYRSRTRILN